MKTHLLASMVVAVLSAQACQNTDPPVLAVSPLSQAGPGPTLGEAGPTLAEPGPSLGEPGTMGPGVAVVPAPTLAPVVWPEGMDGGPGEVPVLWPAGLEVSAATWSKGVGWYTASLPLDGHHVVVHGSRLRVDPMGVGGVGLEADRGPVVTRMDGIVEGDLVRFGAAYTVAVECARPLEDARCVGDAYVLGLVAALRVEVGP